LQERKQCLEHYEKCDFQKKIKSGIFTDAIIRKMLQAFDPTTETNALN